MSYPAIARSIAVLKVAVLLSACSLIGIQQAAAEVIQVVVGISNGRIYVKPEEIDARRGDTIEWVSQNGAYLITLPGARTPFSTLGAYSFERVPGEHVVSAPVLLQTPLGRYKYNVRVDSGNQFQVLDPWIIVRN